MLMFMSKKGNAAFETNLLFMRKKENEYFVHSMNFHVFKRYIIGTLTNRTKKFRAVESHSGPGVLILVRGHSDMFSSNGVIVK